MKAEKLKIFSYLKNAKSKARQRVKNEIEAKNVLLEEYMKLSGEYNELDSFAKTLSKSSPKKKRKIFKINPNESIEGWLEIKEQYRKTKGKGKLEIKIKRKGPLTSKKSRKKNKLRLRNPIFFSFKDIISPKSPLKRNSLTYKNISSSFKNLATIIKPNLEKSVDIQYVTDTTRLVSPRTRKRLNSHLAKGIIKNDEMAVKSLIRGVESYKKYFRHSPVHWKNKLRSSYDFNNKGSGIVEKKHQRTFSSDFKKNFHINPVFDLSRNHLVREKVFMPDLDPKKMLKKKVNKGNLLMEIRKANEMLKKSRNRLEENNFKFGENIQKFNLSVESGDNSMNRCSPKLPKREKIRLQHDNFLLKKRKKINLGGTKKHPSNYNLNSINVKNRTKRQNLMESRRLMLRGSSNLFNPSKRKTNSKKVLIDDNFYIKNHNSLIVKLENMKKEHMAMLQMSVERMKNQSLSIENQKETRSAYSKRGKNVMIKGAFMVDFRENKIKKVMKIGMQPQVDYGKRLGRKSR